MVGAVLTAGVSTACIGRLTPSVSCDAIRSLRMDMTQEEVTKILGPPVRAGFLIEPPEERSPLLWQYNSDMGLFGGMKFEVRFVKSRLAHVKLSAISLRDSAIMTFFNQEYRTLYWLNEDGLFEQPAFSEHLNCR